MHRRSGLRSGFVQPITLDKVLLTIREAPIMMNLPPPIWMELLLPDDCCDGVSVGVLSMNGKRCKQCKWSVEVECGVWKSELKQVRWSGGKDMAGKDKHERYGGKNERYGGKTSC